MPAGARAHVSIRLSFDGVRRIDELAAAEGLTRSEMIRQLLTAAITRHVPSADRRPL
jgi:predicted transcriptional regulator